MFRSFTFFFASASSAVADSAPVWNFNEKGQTENWNFHEGDQVAVLTDFATLDPAKVTEAFDKIYSAFLENFDVSAHDHLMKEVREGVASFLESKAFNGYRTIPNQQQCSGSSGGIGDFSVRGITPFPGGPTARIFGSDLSGLLVSLTERASGAAAGNVMVPLLMTQGLHTAMGLIQSVLSIVLQVVPPMVPPPVWINQPLTCLPMVTGRNCLGAVLYPITAADSVTAEQTDSGLGGDVSSFPTLYRSKVGRTSDAAYRRCFGSYMSMKCSSAFPMCMRPTSFQFPGERLPICLTSCMAVLALCPGFWVDDVEEDCTTGSLPPFCSQALYLNFKNMPPQIVTDEESADANAPLSCASNNFNVEPSPANYELYSVAGEGAGSTASALPPAI